MKLKSKTSPFIRDNNTGVVKMMRNVVIALMPVVLSAIYFYQLNYILTLIVALISVVGVEYLASRILKQESTIYNYSAIITAVLYSLTLSIGTPLWVTFIGGVFATIFAKLVFGGLGNNIFNPAGIARIFVLISFGAVVPNPTTIVDAVSSATPLGTFALDGASAAQNFAIVQDSYTLKQLLIGGTPGGYGETARLSIIIGGAYLLYTKAADYRIMLSTTIMFVTMAFIYAMVNDLASSFVLFQLLSGGFMFGMVFMATDPVTGPSTPPARILYGLLIGALTFIIRVYGAYPEGMLFAILFMNMFSSLLDFSKWSSQKINRGWTIAIASSFIVMCLVVVIA